MTKALDSIKVRGVNGGGAEGDNGDAMEEDAGQRTAHELDLDSLAFPSGS
eukprot:CAMPEP_0183728894 /NCGR_PEP_ID=MMETSP0737-20130205/29204_1 /TAXON_ID=385413 /ORGANISM="Thalassiosira miniscula, Strain CCMP1093" /LENGTH=49 /DNA_ID= /DNA_START= /DNA_END= /DNA_ORIENTATION=